jgi:hypothetical protein
MFSALPIRPKKIRWLVFTNRQVIFLIAFTILIKSTYAQSNQEITGSASEDKYREDQQFCPSPLGQHVVDSILLRYKVQNKYKGFEGKKHIESGAPIYNHGRDISDYDNCINVAGYAFGGMGGGFSLEYERRFSGQQAGLGIRGGIGIAAFKITYTSFPVQVIYLAGSKGNYLELGAGITPIRNNLPEIDSAYSVGKMPVPYPIRWSAFETATLAFRSSLGSEKNIGLVRLGITYFYGYGLSRVIPLVSFEAAF